MTFSSRSFIHPSFSNNFGRTINLVFIISLIVTSQLCGQTGVLTVNGTTQSQTGQTYAATQTDQSAVFVLNSGQLTLTNCTMTKTGDASNVNNSSQYGLNAGVLANAGGQITITGGSITTNASGGNGVFASGSGSSVTISDATIHASGGSAHGVDVTYGGVMTLTNVNVTTTGSNSSALATDFGGGTVHVTGGVIAASSTSSNSHSAGIYSTGTISVSDATISSAGDCGGVIDGANTINLANTSLSGPVEGIKVWKTAPMSGTANVTISGGSLSSANGDGFYVTGETGNAASANLLVSNGATITAGTGNIVKAVSPATATFTTSNVNLTGNLVTTGSSTITASLTSHSTLVGKIQTAGLTIDTTSSWTLTAHSTLTTLIDAGGISGTSITNITGNGFNVHYDSALTANHYLGGRVYSLVNGGYLTPESVSGVASECECLPSETALLQNYPNPFNPSTSITYSVVSPGPVTLRVFDLLGREVATLVNESRQAGTHTLAFDGSHLASGTYLYQLTTSGKSYVRRMTLLK
jgi:hypothetical protein